MRDGDMEAIFDLVVCEPEHGGPGETEVRLGIRCTLAGTSTVCPVRSACSRMEDLEAQVKEIRGELERVLERARRTFEGPGAAETADMEDLPAEQLWESLASIFDDARFVERFNALEEPRRRAVAEHVLTACSVFSGRPALFSSRYDAESALLRD